MSFKTKELAICLFYGMFEIGQTQIKKIKLLMARSNLGPIRDEYLESIAGGCSIFLR